MKTRLARTLDYLLMQGDFDPKELSPVQKHRQLAVLLGLMLAAVVLTSLT